MRCNVTALALVIRPAQFSVPRTNVMETRSVDLMQKCHLEKKTWRIDTDSIRLLESLKVCVCDGHHDHLPSKDVNWKETQHCPKKLCELILRGCKAELTAHVFAYRKFDVSPIPS